MFNKTVMRSVLAIVVLVLLAGLPTFAAANFATVDEDHAVVTVSYADSSDSNIRVVLVHAKGKEVFSLTEAEQEFPLSFGSGEYLIGLYKHVEGNQYKLIAKQSFTAKINKNAQYLASAYDVQWNKNDAAILKAQELVKGAKTDEEKVQRIYDYVVANVKYDYKKAASVQAGYLPDVDATFLSNEGICYDYASLTAAMLRSVGIPTQLRKGYKDDIAVYHAWNAVYLNGEWKTVDTTYDAALSDSLTLGKDLFKADSSYQVEKAI
jgi:transglutaminase-like putative cysteine protease